jgi:hypothetical protein
MQMKQMIRNGGESSGNERISKMRWNKWLEMVEKTETSDE